MVAIFSLLTVLTLSVLATRIGTMALMLTGLSREAARFQARSAFTGVGFTTSESELIVSHPMRRQIVMTLMLVGNAGIATMVATLIASLINVGQDGQRWVNLSMLGAGLILLYLITTSRFIERQLNKVISFGLRKFSRLEVRDYVSLLQLSSGFTVSELKVGVSDWLAGKRIMESRLAQEGILVLGIHRQDGTFIGAPTGHSEIQARDSLVIYGPIHRLEELDSRDRGRKGDRAHQAAVREHDVYLEEAEAEV